jgi:hypothetical protein
MTYMIICKIITNELDVLQAIQNPNSCTKNVCTWVWLGTLVGPGYVGDTVDPQAWILAHKRLQ